MGALTENGSKFVLPRSGLGALLALALTSAVLLSLDARDYPSLHIILDTGICLLSGVLALLLSDIGARTSAPFGRWLAIVFGLVFFLAFLHVLVVVEWTGPLAGIAASADVLRPSTWPPAAHLLPLGIAAALWSLRRGDRRLLGFGVAMLALGLASVFVFYLLPRYAAPDRLGISRPALVLAPPLAALVAWACWHFRRLDRFLAPLALMAAVLALADLAMLYSRAPHDGPAMVAHLNMVGAFMVLLLSLMRMASRDMSERLQVEEALAHLNAQLEARVVERTTTVRAVNQALEAEVGVRRETETKANAQLARLNLLRHITRAIGERQDLESIFQVVVGSIEDELPVDFCCACLHDATRGVLVVTSIGRGSDALARTLGLANGTEVAINANGLSRCVAGQLVYDPDLTAVLFPFFAQLAAAGLRSLVASPLLVESRVFGVLLTSRLQVHAFSSGDCEFLRQVSEHVALAAHQAQLHDALLQAYEDLRQTQQAVMQQERLRALGQMASGIAHDINNAISPVALYAESLLEQEPGLSPRGREYLAIIQRAGEDVGHTVGRMKEFYRRGDAEVTLTPIVPCVLVQQVVALTRARWSDMPQQRGVVIHVVVRCEPDLPTVLGNESDVREALTNLVFNAVDAMPEGGTLGLRTRRDGSDVAVEVSDTGPGMDELTRGRCFEPFFTTKGERGTGLGLAMVYGIMQRLGGEIEIDTAPGRGTTVRLTFPIAVVPVPLTVPAPVLPLTTRLHILLVDDDPLVLRSLRDTLEADRHVVVIASSGQAGIDAFRAAREGDLPFAVVITDLGMPHIDGRRVASEVKAASPTTPVILLTGWGQRLLAEGDVPPDVDRVLSKPPRLRDLREALAQCCRAPAVA